MALLVILVAALILWLTSRSGSSSAGSPPAPTPAPAGGTSIESYGVDTIAQAVSMVESGGREYDSNGNLIVSPRGAIGVMQLMPSTATQLGVDPTDAGQNYQGGTDYLQQLYNQFGNWPDALAAYNWGPGNVSKAQASGSPYPTSVQDYIANVEAQLGG